MKFMRMALAVMFVFALMVGSVCEAALAETVDDGAELARVKRLAIGYPDYFKTMEKEPTIDELLNALYDASKVSHNNITSYDDMATKIKRDTGVDIKVIPKMEARKIFKEHVYKYADAYLLVTVANNSRVSMFCDVYAVNTNERIYSIQIQTGKSDENKTTKAYKAMAEEFYKAFDKAVQTEAKKESKKDK